MSTTLFVANPHDNGYDLIPGDSVTNARIGHVYWDDQDEGGLVLALDAQAGVCTPETAQDAADLLREAGYDLDPDSIAKIEALRREKTDA